jgi:hypothetical protein
MKENLMPESTGTAGPAIGELHEVRARFDSADRMQEATGKLEMSGFNRADLSLPEPHAPTARSTPESGAEPVDTDVDAQQARTVRASTAASIAAVAAAGLTIGTGGAAAPAIAAALAAGSAFGAGGYFISRSASSSEQRQRDERAEAGELILSVHTTSPEKRAEAERILHDCGALEVQVVGGP